ncbi:MAG: PAS domain-containing sensor histidine kinase [Burkholderiaceae bacterium]
MSKFENRENRPQGFFRLIAKSVAVLITIASAIALYRAVAGFDPVPSFLSMQPPIALGLLMAGAALWLSSEGLALAERWKSRCLLAARILGAIVFLFGIATFLVQFSSSGAGTGVTPFAAFASIPSLVASGFVLAGISLAFLDSATVKGQYVAEYAALAIAGLMSIPIIGYLYSAGGLVQIASSSAVPLPAAFLLAALAIGLLCARPGHPLMRLWNSTAPGGHLLRELLPKSLLLLVLLDLLVEGGARRGLYARENISSLVVLLTTIWLTVLFWRAASLLNREYDVRRKGEAALSETSALLRAVSDNTPDAIFVKDRRGRIVFANPATLRMLGKSADQVIGRRAGELYSDANAAQIAEASDRSVMESGRAEVVEETLELSGGMRTIYSTKAPWIDARGETLGLVGISVDITERKRMEDALKEHETQLEALVAARTAEVSELIGHLESTREEEKRKIARELHDDLGSALTALNMHLAILFQQMPQDPRLDERSAQVKALLSTVTQTTRRIQAGLRPDKLDIFGIKTAIAEQVLEFEDYTGIRCSASLPDEEVSYTSQIEIALFRMVQEALNNIAKHAKASHVDVVLDDSEDCIMLTVRDNGIGMSAAQAAQTVTHGLRGMRERASYLGGDVQIVSELGKGTRIIITLPKPAGAHPAPATESDQQDEKRIA